MTDTITDAPATGLPIPMPRLPPRVAAGARPHGLSPGELVKLYHSLAESPGHRSRCHRAVRCTGT